MIQYAGTDISISRLGGLKVTWDAWRGRLKLDEVAEHVQAKLRDVSLPTEERRLWLGIAASVDGFIDALDAQKSDDDEEALDFVGGER